MLKQRMSVVGSTGESGWTDIIKPLDCAWGFSERVTEWKNFWEGNEIDKYVERMRDLE